jgi:hypothetical protein
MRRQTIWAAIGVVALSNATSALGFASFGSRDVGRSRAGGAVPTPGKLKVYGDWIVGCDNFNSCHATSLIPQDPGAEGASDASGGALVSVKRDAAERAFPVIAISIISGLDDGPLVNVAQLMVDDRKLDVAFEFEQGIIKLAPCSGGALIQKLLAGKTLDLLDDQGDIITSASLVGLRDALRDMDFRQKREGTSFALIEKGSRRYVGPASVQPYPVIRIPDPTVKSPARLTVSAGETARAFYKCPGTDDVMRSREIKYVRLDRNSTLAIIPALCGTSAYNSTVRVAILDNVGRIRAPRFDMREAGQIPDQFINGWWDESKALLSSYVKARGIGDCGLAERYAWDGQRFRLAERKAMSECRGSIDYITTWRANIVRGSSGTRR